ncbi:aromatic ring-hydroxylating dioxygenase subunit alpha [Aquabacterium sp. J223]|uniref:aromatic ring-hydroxylating dioxygenase subunit alpha n=1 Tax=Aquabacterium sp. J223 TaxID=2898431 RepID=UPI0021ADC7B4|nr:aromatic ring-hydroxylating dioxygenase subunit alpha [Aquabacterium sp. J223]UUX95468.1 aromatic ring-hydroxylating dioxygenase subunit alpha [Aquabacterium sp. J223]
MNRWWVAGFSWELKDKPLARTFLGRAMVLFRTPDGRVGALEDRCCHKELPLSCGAVEDAGLRCGYHGLLFDTGGRCIEIPGQDRIPAKAKVRSYPLVERDKILWVWIGDTPDAQPADQPPAYPVHSDPRYQYGGDSFHYDAPWQLIHDNLLDLSHLGYVHTKTIGGNPTVHMNAKLTVDGQGEVVRVVRLMPNSEPPPTYSAAWPFTGRIDRWQEVEFRVSHLLIWTGAMDVGTGRFDDPEREGFHMRGFHGVTPETEGSAHYFWTIATNPHPDKDNVTQLVVDQTAATFYEDKDVIEAQWRNQQRFPVREQIDIHVDIGPNRARRVIAGLLKA